jgi:ABC-type glycerol-3-phosphate transport system permease component
MIIGTNTSTAIGLFVTLGVMILGLVSTYPAVRASEKGRNFIKWYIFSLVLFPIALVASFIIKSKKIYKDMLPDK